MFSGTDKRPDNLPLKKLSKLFRRKNSLLNKKAEISETKENTPMTKIKYISSGPKQSFSLFKLLNRKDSTKDNIDVANELFNDKAEIRKAEREPRTKESLTKDEKVSNEGTRPEQVADGIHNEVIEDPDHKLSSSINSQTHSSVDSDLKIEEEESKKKEVGGEEYFLNDIDDLKII